jgi:gliding motility-associated-like protein
MEIKVYAPFTASAAFNEVYLCPGDEVQFSVQPTDKKVVWSPGADISNINVYNPLVKPLASTVYTATLSDSANCFQSAVQVRALLKKPPLVDAGTPMLLPYNAPFTFSPVYSNNIVHYSWTPPANINCLNCPVPSGNAITSALYTVTVESDSGCVAKDTVSIRVQCSDASLFMASAFTPNSDNLNDYYYPLLKGVKKVLRFTIYNRYGQIIFEAKNFNPGDKTNGWNGKHNGIDQPASNYQYSLDAICEQGELIQKKGTFTLIR